jgi:hypothetical protein
MPAEANVEPALETRSHLAYRAGDAQKEPLRHAGDMAQDQ